VAVVEAAAGPAAPVFAASPETAARPKAKFSFGRKPMRIPELAPEFAYDPARPPGPRPIRKRTWLMILMALAAIWLFAKPRPPEKAFAGQVDEAMVMIDSCKLEPARAALSSLKAAKAPPAQLARVQNALREAGPVCLKKRARDKIDGARAAALLDQADACLARKDRVCLESRLLAAEKLQRPELAPRIAALREALSKLLEATVLEAPPAAAAGMPPALLPQPQVMSTTPTQQVQQQLRTTLAAARQDMAQSNYQAAADRLGACAAVLDTGDSECRRLKQQAERLNTELLRCLANNRTWMDGRCL
jgi:hypothetical protein